MSTAQRLQSDELPECTRILDVLAPAFADSQLDVPLRERQRQPRPGGGPLQARPAPAPSRAPSCSLSEDGEWRISDPG